MSGARSARPSARQATVIAATGALSVAFAGTMIYFSQFRNYPSLVALVIADAIGLCFVVAGLAAWWLRPANPIGRLMVLAGALWYVGNLQVTGNPTLYAIGFWLMYVRSYVIAHLAVIYPDGQFRRPAERWLVISGYGFYLVVHGIRYLHEGDGHQIGWPDSNPTTVLTGVTGAHGLVYCGIVLGLMVRRWRTASASARRLHSPVFLGVVYASLLPPASIVASQMRLPDWFQIGLFLTYGLSLASLPFAFLSGLMWVRLARQRVADLVEALKDPADPWRLRDLLAHALVDPHLVVAFWSDTTDGYVDGNGRPVAVPDVVAERAVTVVEGRDVRLAALIHDPALADQQPLVRGVVAAARLALENARLHAFQRAQLTELAASRARIAAAALNERRAIERDLHDGLQHNLLRLSWLAEQTGAQDLATEARAAYTALKELARGIHPAILTERGLAAAVEEHALRSSIPMIIDIPQTRWAAPIEATAYFVILEATTNSAKHACANRVDVTGSTRANRLTIEIVDDGVGGADPRYGTGLRGLQDRVSALGGTLTVHSSLNEGTRVVAEPPCA
jgi:signal transduction histidine kinase